MSAPIGEHALLSDGQGAALVHRTGSIDWACLVRFDAPSVFARLLDADAGHWSLGPVADAETRRWYLPDSMVLRTEHRTADGTVSVTDALVFQPLERGHGIGQRAPHAIVRVVEGLEGRVEMATEVAPRPEYGLVDPVWEAVPGGARARGGPLGAVLSSPVALDLTDGTARATATVSAGERLGFALRATEPWRAWPGPWTTDQCRAWMHGTVRGWQSWAEMHQSYEGPWAELVHHSGRVLQALTYAPTGAVVAAPTTSLPEVPGGELNWDYRYSWVRDASLTLNALWVAACPDEVERFFEFFVTAAGGRRRDHDVQIVYGIGGERRVPESELDHLAGYGGARPVRVGNEAWRQTQLDVHGELLDAAAVFADDVGRFDPVVADFLAHLADRAAARWTEPDQGIWEDRGEPRHHLYSALMCWVALDRAVDLADALGVGDDRVGRWAEERDRIRAAVLDRGWDDDRGTFTATLDDDDRLDAAVLMLPIVGFLPGDDERVRSTLRVVDEELGEGGWIRRDQDEERAGEGAFVITTFWMAHALALAGDVEAARARFELAAGAANDVGLLAEEVDPATGDALGNFPQAFSHIGLVNAAWAIATAERR